MERLAERLGRRPALAPRDLENLLATTEERLVVPSNRTGTTVRSPAPGEPPAALSAPAQEAPPALVDLRSPASFRAGHVRSAVSIPASALLDSLYLLPPRGRPLILMAQDGPTAAQTAEGLRGRGFTAIGWLDGSPRDLDRRLLLRGPAANRIWEPSGWLRRHLTDLPRGGRACDLACGSGRNAVFLALDGRAVLGVDILDDALRQARVLARRAGVSAPGSVSFRRADLRDAAQRDRLLRPERFAVLLCFRYLDRALFARMAQALRPGGWLLVEAFLEEQARAKGRPRRSEFLLKPGELRAAFPGLEVIADREGTSEEGDHLASLAARRKP